MDVTLLGSGDAAGMPAPLCGCEFCAASDPRRRPGLLVETPAATVVLDASPDLADALRAADVTAVDAVFLTHAHRDHSAGLHALSQAGKWPADHLAATETFEPAFDRVATVYCTATAYRHLRESRAYLVEKLATGRLTPGDPVAVGDLAVTPFRVDHARPTFDTVGFAVEHEGRTVAYAPDAKRVLEREPAAGADLLFVEGAALFGTPLHGPADALRETVDGVDADRVVLLTLSEHKARMHTGELRERAADLGHELGADDATYGL